MPPPAAPAAGPPTWPPSAPPSSRPSRTPATCTSPKAAATTPPPPKPSASTASIRAETDTATRRSPVLGLPGAGAKGPGPGRSVLSQVEDDLLGLDLAVVVDQVQPRTGSRGSLAERAACHRQAEQQQRVMVIPGAGQHPCAGGHDRLHIRDQALHVIAGAGEIGVRQGGVGRCG